MKKKKIIDAQKDSKGNISAVKFQGNKNFTSVEKAIEIAKREGIENAHVVNKKYGNKYLRSNPDNKESNNLDELANK